MTAWDPPQSTPESEAASALTVDPFNSLAAHYGMLLGVSDFQVIGANPRGKLQLHQAWQHGAGVHWGFDVSVADDGLTIRVGPGMVTDSLGREVASGAEMCLDVGAWFTDRQASDPGFKPRGGPTRYEFSARLWVRHAACLARRVPSVSSGCAGADDSVLFSRVHEFGRLGLEPYERAEDLCGSDDTSDEPPVSALDAAFASVRDLVRDGTVPALPCEPAGWLDAFRSVAAQSAAKLAPPGYAPGGEGTLLFPEDDPSPVLLADLPHIVVEEGADKKWRVTVDLIDLSVRRTHLPAILVEELIAEALAGHAGSVPMPDAGGPRVRRCFAAGSRIHIDLTGNIIEGTLLDALEVRSIDRGAADPSWSDPIRVRPRYAEATATDDARVTIRLPDQQGDIWNRVILRGTGPAPLLGQRNGRLVPLAGRVGDPPGSADDGHDVAAMLRRDGA